MDNKNDIIVDNILYSIEDIKKMLPHRYPFLLIDKVIKVTEEGEIIGQKNVTYNEPFFGGHFPDMHIMPGVLQVEALAQLVGLLAIHNMETKDNRIVFFSGIDNVKFRSPVTPGDVLILKANITKQKTIRGSLIIKGEGKIYIHKNDDSFVKATEAQISLQMPSE